VILTKTMSRQGDQVSRDVDRYLREIGSEVLDVVLLHFQTAADWPRRYRPAMEALSRAKEAGKVRAVGVSCHSVGALKAAVDSQWAEVVMARINHRGVQMDAAPQRVVPVLNNLAKAGIAVVGMKVLGAGHLRQDVAAQVDYVLGLGGVQAITIGMTERGQLSQNIRIVTRSS
jgi:predicted aldo/keto reductase-like oxidoreductase